MFRVLAKIALIKHLEGLVAELPDKSKAKTNLLGLLQHFQSYATYNAAFAAPNPDDVEGEEDDDADASTLGGEKTRPLRTNAQRLVQDWVNCAGLSLRFLGSCVRQGVKRTREETFRAHRLVAVVGT